MFYEREVKLFGPGSGIKKARDYLNFENFCTSFLNRYILVYTSHALNFGINPITIIFFVFRIFFTMKRKLFPQNKRSS